MGGVTAPGAEARKRAADGRPVGWRHLRRRAQAFVWPAVRDGDIVRAARERLLVLFALITGLGGTLSALNGLATIDRFPVSTAVGLAGSLAILAVPVYFHRTGAFRRSVWIALTLQMGTVVLINSLNGGLLTVYSVYLLAAPVGTGLLLGMRPALAVGAAVTGIVVLHAVLLPQAGILPPGPQPQPWQGNLAFVMVMMALGLALAVGAFHRVIDRTSRQLKEARDAAEAANEAKSRFLANMSHELRTPINVVLGFAELMDEEGLPPRTQAHLKQIRNASSDLLAMVNDVLDYGRAEAGGLVLEVQPFDLLAVADDLRERFQPLADHKQLALQVTVAPEAPRWIHGDALRLRQLLGNLLANAVKFTERGHIALDIACPDPQTVPLRLQFDVTDTGIGIPEAALPTLFDRFTQADASTTRRFGGSGLGLAIVRTLADRMGGQVEVASRPGEGSRFRVTLVVQPAAAPQAADAMPGRAAIARTAPEPAMAMPAAHAAPAAAAAAARPGRILLVEDSEANQHLFATGLQRAGHEVRIAGDGRAALEALQQEPFDLVLMDGEMPVMNGTDAARAIRASGAPHAGIPIIALTANAMARDAAAFRAAGMDDFLAKPVSLRQLQEKVAEWLQRRRD
ncbi:ATP-binding protein [Marinibaculum pumilum]|uniref:histidine kinase n=1 Tax=Marinibaculum pumilum TaxID=1766165 RepID=A0ABV7L8N9_9PROT